jgi:hypothetical protein
MGFAGTGSVRPRHPRAKTNSPTSSRGRGGACAELAHDRVVAFETQLAEFLMQPDAPLAHDAAASAHRASRIPSGAAGRLSTGAGVSCQSPVLPSPPPISQR